MTVTERDRVAFDRTLAGLAIPSDPPNAFDATIVPDELASWSSFREPGPLPSIPVRFPDAQRSNAELDLVELIGEGGMGRVYLASQRSLGREVAVKTVRHADSAEAVAALCDEAVVTGRLSHPNVIPVHALGRDDEGRPLLVMKRVQGVGWDALLGDPRHPFWDKNEIAEDDRQLFHVEVLRQIAHAVAFAHSHGVLHRDVKPENVMIGDFGETYLVDWGLAARTGSSTEGRLAGTPAYLAPEMVGGVVDERTDVYLLGATLCEILNGAPPHDGDTLQRVLLSAFVSEPPAFGDDVPAELAGLCRRALARDPDDRPTSAAAFGDALANHVRHRGSQALTRTAEARLRTLADAVEESAPETRDLATLRRLVSECRFAFLEARAGWTENPAVASGLAACLNLAARIEIDRRDAEAARAVWSELEDADPELEREIVALEEELTREASERARLEAMAHDLDPSVGAGARVTAAAVALLLALFLSGYGSYVELTRGLILSDLLYLSLAMTVGLGIILLVARRRILTTTFNRRFAGWVAVGCAMEVAHRAYAMWTGRFDVVEVIALDLVSLGAFFAVGSLFLFRWMAVAGVALGLCAIPAHLHPDLAPTIFGLATIGAVLGFALTWRRGKRAVS